MMTLIRVIDQALFGESLTVGQLFPILFFKMSSTASEFTVVHGGSAENQRTTDKTDLSTKPLNGREVNFIYTLPLSSDSLVQGNLLTLHIVARQSL